MPKSDLFEYKWANLESFFETPKSVRCTEMAGTLIARGSRALSATSTAMLYLPRSEYILCHNKQSSFYYFKNVND